MQGVAILKLMMRSVALVIVSLAVYVHGQSTAQAMDSLSAYEPSPTFSSDETAYSTAEKSPVLSSISPGPLAVSDITSTTVKGSIAVILSSMTLSDTQSLSMVTSTRGTTEVEGSSTMAEVPDSSVMPTDPATLSDFMSAHVSVTTRGHPLPSAPSVNSTLARTPTPTRAATPTPSHLPPTEFQLAIALPASVFGYTSLLIILALVSLFYVDHLFMQLTCLHYLLVSLLMHDC